MGSNELFIFSKFNAQKMCASLCLQHKVNETLDNFVKGKEFKQPNEPPEHINFMQILKK